MCNILHITSLFYKYAAGIYEGYRDKIEDLSKENPYPFRDWFGPDGRAYIEFQPLIGGVDENVKKLLEKYGYTITNYSTGLASKEGRVRRIGKILAKIRKEKIKELDLKNQLNEVENYDEELKEINQYMNKIEIEFQTSKYRVSEGQKHLIVFSQNPHDVAKMSTDRGWTSCMELGKGKMRDDVYCEVKGGGFVAYLITKEDKDIEKPLARIHIRRFDNDKGVSIAVPEESIYGNSLPGFPEAVKDWLDRKQRGLEYGEYKRKGGTSSDTLKQTYVVTPTNKKEIAQFIKTLCKTNPDLERLLKSQNLPKGIIKELAPGLYRNRGIDRVNWRYISRNKKLSEAFIREFADKLNWGAISERQKLSEPFIKEFADKVDWFYISKSHKLSEPFIREFADKIDWSKVSEYQTLSEPFIREFANKVNWDYISEKQKLSESFIREFDNKVNWLIISINQKLSEDFIREFADKINWAAISRTQKLSEKFKKEFAHKLKS